MTTSGIDEGSTRGIGPFDWVRWALLAAYVGLLVSLPFVATLGSTMGDLESELDAGDVSVVEVSGGEELADLEGRRGARGEALQQVTWRDGLVERRAEVTWVVGERPDRVRDDETLQEIGAWLEEEYDVEVRRVAEDLPRSSLSLWHEGPEFSGPGWIGPFALGGGLASLWLLIAGPEPWRATRWAWFWLFVTPIGGLAFLALSGPGTSPAPRDPDRRLTGGWAFLLGFLVMPMVNGIVAAALLTLSGAV